MWTGGGCEVERETIGEIPSKILSDKEGGRRHVTVGALTYTNLPFCCIHKQLNLD